jgi:hypothetical protein
MSVQDVFEDSIIPECWSWFAEHGRTSTLPEMQTALVGIVSKGFDFHKKGQVEKAIFIIKSADSKLKVQNYIINAIDKGSKVKRYM